MQSYPSHPSKVPPFSADAEKWLNKSLGFGEYSPYVGGGGNIPRALNFKKSAHVKKTWNIFTMNSSKSGQN